MSTWYQNTPNLVNVFHRYPPLLDCVPYHGMPAQYADILSFNRHPLHAGICLAPANQTYWTIESRSPLTCLGVSRNVSLLFSVPLYLKFSGYTLICHVLPIRNFQRRKSNTFFLFFQKALSWPFSTYPVDCSFYKFGKSMKNKFGKLMKTMLLKAQVRLLVQNSCSLIFIPPQIITTHILLIASFNRV